MENKTDLERLQKFELKMLSDFAEVCDKHHLRYFLYGGTLLGAVRHKGFIPWDDDIDIAMLWDDYVKLLEILQSDIGDRYFVQNLWTEKGYPCLWTQLRANGTTSMPVRSKELDIHWGICIDIFPLISMADDETRYIKQRKAFKRAQDLLVTDLMKAQEEKAHGLQWIINCLPNKVRHLLVKAILKKHAVIDDQQTWLGGLDSAELKRKYKLNDFKSSKKYEFEGEWFWGPINGESVLECNYGKNWMTPPPANKRGGHDLPMGDIVVDLDQSYKKHK